MDIWQIISIISGALTAVLGVIALVQREKAKVLRKERKREEANLEKISNAVLQKLDPHISDCFDKKTALLVKKEDFDGLNIKVDGVEKTLDSNNKYLIEFEKSRLRGEILWFGEDLKSGIKKSSVAYQYIHSVFAQYKKLGGNSFVCDLFDKIKEAQKTGKFPSNEADL